MSAQLITVDWETYYSREYSLSKLTNEEYVRDPRFEAIGVSIKVDRTPAEWFTGTQAELARILSRYDWKEAAVLSHNAPFDMSIMSYHYGIRPKLILDTLSMARAKVGMHTNLSLAALARYFGVGTKGDAVIAAMGKRRADFTENELAEYGVYCCNDDELCFEIFDILRVGFPKEEIQLIDLTVRMATEPVINLDRQILWQHLADVIERKATLLENLGERHGKDVLMSNPKFAAALREFGIDPPMKISPATGRETFAFAKKDEEFIALAEHENPDVQALVAARLGLKSTLEETRTQRLLAISDRGPLPIALRYYAAHTGRWGGDGKINPQNFPRKSRLKYALQAPPGYVLIDADSSQIEARVLAWLAGQWDLIEAFEDGIDVYRLMGPDIYGLEPHELDDLQRFVCKTAVLGCGFGCGDLRFQGQLKSGSPSVSLPLEECSSIIHAYRRKNHRIIDLWYRANNALSAMATGRTCMLDEHGVLRVEGRDGIRLPNGMLLEYPNLRWEPMKEGERPQFIYDTKLGKTKRKVKIYGASLTENFTQAIARIVIGEQMLMIKKRYKVALTVHDAVCAVVPIEEEEEGRDFVEACLRTRPTWAPGLPLNCEVGSGPTYGDC
jgi:DNA polymerase I-like protein with 3'-5' exonuclease and polymerase domains